MKKILIIEDDIWILQSLKLYLESSDFVVNTHTDWWTSIDKIKQLDPDLVILDINLPNKNWIEICREVRLFSDLPIIILTARTWELDKIELLEIWADDYIAKPFSPRELLARIKNSIKRTNIKKEEKSEIEKWNFILFENIKLDIDKMKIFVNKKEIQITKNEFDIAKKIFEENWRLVSREILMKEVIWYDKYLYDRTLDTHIKNLRKKLEKKDVILTVRGEGYRLNK
jgi:two-component system response regulator BaeR